MADEMKKNIDNEEIELDALEDVSGGLIVKPKNSWFGYYKVVDDNTGKVLKSDYYLKDAKEDAARLNVSGEIISKEEYKKRFEKDI